MEYTGTAVVTGATSFIASGLLPELESRGYQIYAVCRPASKNMYRLPKSAAVKAVFCELHELSVLPALIGEKCDVFFHLGWETREKNDLYLQNKNVAYTLDAVRAAGELQCGTFVGVGSQAEYGLADTTLGPDTPAFPVSGYGMAKLCAGQMSRKFCAQLGLRHIWLRVVSIYGPMDAPGTLVSCLIRSLLCQRSPALTKGGQVWDYLFISDCARAIFLAAQKGRDGAVYVLGSGEKQRLSAYIEQIRDQIAPGLRLDFGGLAYSTETPMFLSADISKLTEDTGFLPEVSFQAGIRRTVEWFRQKGRTAMPETAEGGG